MSQRDGNERRRVVVTGLGAYTSLGGTVQASWERALAGESGISRIERWDPASFELPVGIGGEIKETPDLPWLDAREARNIARFARYAVVAAAEAMSDAGLSPDAGNYDPERSGAIVGTAAGGMDVIAETTRTFDARGYRRISPFFMVSFPHNMGTYHVAQTFRLLGPSSAVSTACATGAQAIADAAEFIRRGQADVMLGGGAEHAVFPLFIASFVVQKAATTRGGDPAHASRPFDGEREGFVIGDGAGMVVLEELEHARARGATIYAELLGTGSSNDGYHPIAPEPEGRGAAHAIRMAIEDAGIAPEQIDYVNAHAASTPLGDAAETAAIKRALGEEHAYRIPVSSTKSMIGHTMGAAGAIESIMTVLSIRDNRVHPTLNQDTPDPACDLDYVPNESRQVEVNIALKNSFGLGGQNAALIFGKVGLMVAESPLTGRVARRASQVRPAQGQAFEVREGQFLQISDMLGKQVAVCVGFNLHDFDETLSPANTRLGNNALMLREGHILYSSRHNRMLTIIADSVGRHDMLMPACNAQRYAEDYGIADHGNCVDNIVRAMEARKYTIEPDKIPDPINFFMNVGFKAGGELDIREPLSNRNDNVLLKALMDCLIVISACPNEQSPMNGFKPTDLLVRVYQ